MKKIKINPGCISCGACAFRAPEVFEVADIAHVKKDADIEKFSAEILAAKEACPVGVICCEQKSNKKEE